jgi:hypothetical protein
VTGITKFARGGFYSAFNNPSDISLRPEHGALTGFTQGELEKYYRRHLEEAAIIKKSLLKNC